MGLDMLMMCVGSVLRRDMFVFIGYGCCDAARALTTLSNYSVVVFYFPLCSFLMMV